MKPMIYADNHKKTRDGFAKILESHYKVRVDKVDDGMGLVEMVRKEDYSIVITDHNMGFMSGLEAISEIKEFNPQVPIIIVSAQNIEQKALEIGASAYLKKPIVDWDQLFEAIDRLSKA